MNSNPYKRARFNREKSMDSERLQDLHAQMTECVLCAVDNFAENNPHLSYVSMDLSDDDELAMTRLQGLVQQQKQFVEQSVSMYLDVIKPSIPNSALVLAKRFAMSVYETNLLSIMQNVMINEHNSTNNVVCAHSPMSTSSSSCSKKSLISDSSSVHFKGIEATVEPQHVIIPVMMPECSPLSLKSYAYHEDHARATSSWPLDDHEEEDAEVVNVMDMGSGYHHDTSSSVRKAYSPLSSHPSPFSLLAGSVDCAAIISA